MHWMIEQLQSTKTTTVANCLEILHSSLPPRPIPSAFLSLSQNSPPLSLLLSLPRRCRMAKAHQWLWTHFSAHSPSSLYTFAQLYRFRRRWTVRSILWRSLSMSASVAPPSICLTLITEFSDESQISNRSKFPCLSPPITIRSGFPGLQVSLSDYSFFMVCNIIIACLVLVSVEPSWTP